MKKYYTEDTFLAKWIANELSDEELTAFKKTKAYKEFLIINRESQLLVGPTVDTERALKKVTQELEPKTKIKSLWWFSAAASITLLLGLLVFKYSTKTYSTKIGQKELIMLADGSQVHLNTNSHLTHKRFGWDNKKEVHLEGEAYFDIIKGKGFIVETSKGSIAVLGTEFNVRDRGAFEIRCYEGSISFSKSEKGKDSSFLTQGKGLKIKKSNMETFEFTADSPPWKRGVSSFINRPISEILAELQDYYPVEFKINTVRVNRLFTGEFVHNNLNMALEATLTPMGVKFEISENGKLITLSE